MRAISTVLDVSLCLLLVSASALTLAETPTRDDGTRRETVPDSADETADLLATSTASVTYRSSASASAEQFAASAETPQNRTVHDTLAGLLASAVTAKANRRATSFVRAVTARVDRALRRVGLGARVVARRSRAESVSGESTSAESTSGESTAAESAGSDDAARDDSARVVVGPAPPPAADVSAAAFAVRGVAVSVRTWSR
ncbi:hypothetical protein M0R88_12515 [Halorussus gelatinilyticus]|uniref:Uncharacterized protein n=1 Tax=Halorussus gelatinilyticus TaxID=2937524 RepID=A0A8U0IF17_9EURY|nr:hypothetical protein [Halorussus gelatinilyticus]UPV99344.1 hypothetical protein M0R88_12515 [Halorussus gelatinilyticus]